jgi:hypothetical protein
LRIPAGFILARSALGENRTLDLILSRNTLYPLSYEGNPIITPVSPATAMSQTPQKEITSHTCAAGIITLRKYAKPSVICSAVTTLTDTQKRNRQMTAEERDRLAKPILENTRKMIHGAASGDDNLRFAINRYVFARLQVDERGFSLKRKALKRSKRQDQKNLCPLCGGALPEKGAVLDRLNAMDGYTDANTRLICPACDGKVQEERRCA